MSPDPMIMCGKNVLLREPRPDDVAQRLALGRRAEIVRMFGGDFASMPPLAKADVEGWLQGLGEHPHAWIVEHEGRLLGEIRLDAIDQHDRRARLAVGFFDPSKLGRGLGRQAIRLVLEHGFEALQLHRVGLRVIAYNVRAIRCYLACGFKEEGREREVANAGGEWHDDVLMGMLRREYCGLMAQYDHD